MGISAVPGSGKTFTLSLLAARLVERLAAEGRQDEREVLVVTFTNSAVANFRARIGMFLREQGLLAGVGYRVRTLHGLAHDIVRERPGLVGLSEDFDIVDERTALEIKREAVLSYLRTHPDVFAPFIKPEFLQQPRRIERPLLEDAIDLANLVIRVAKELPAAPHTLQHALDRQSGTWPLLDFGLHIYADYQRSLTLRGAVDFDDLILFALQSLEADAGYLARLQARWPYILEDEAQDSSQAQENMLRRLTASHGNWVRVGDPNQAINTTFTSARASFLRRFLETYPEQARDLPNSGRSALPIIELANHLIQWSQAAHPHLNEARALTRPPIEPTPLGDPQPNPPAGTPPIYIHPHALTPDRETETVVRSLQRWLPQNGDKTVAVLVPENHRGFSLTEALEQAGLPFDDSLLRTDSTTRATAQALATVLNYIAMPQSQGGLEKLWNEVWYPRRQARQAAGDGQAAVVARKAPLPEPVAQFGRALGRLREPESFIFPARSDWLGSLNWLDEDPALREQVGDFRRDLQRWTRGVILPVDELLLTLGNDLFAEPADLALTHRLAVLLAKLHGENPAWRLPELAGELENIAQNKRRILGFGEDAQGYVPRPGIATVATMHSAKGL
jgi:DNA helicase-2/ATP-dependent DNA helicase PcrA